jgi:hypothetical protein
MNTLTRNTNIINKDIGVEANAEKTKCVFVSHHQNAGQTSNMKRGNRAFFNFASIKYLRMTLNYIHEEVCNK